MQPFAARSGAPQFDPVALQIEFDTAINQLAFETDMLWDLWLRHNWYGNNAHWPYAHPARDQSQTRDYAAPPPRQRSPSRRSLPILNMRNVVDKDQMF